MATRIAAAGVAGLLAAGAAWNGPAAVAAARGRSDAGDAARARLGELLFGDPGLSRPRGTSCASCHDPARAFAGGNGSGIGVARGSRPGAFGLRNPPSLTYASFIPQFTVEDEAPVPEPNGGLFLDGRANFLDEQAAGPLLSPQEMGNPDRAAVVAAVAAAPYAAAFRAVWGGGIFARTDDAFRAVCRSLAAFESSARFHPFSSRFDDFVAGRGELGPAETRGMHLFFDPERGNCASCHAAVPWASRAPDLFTDFGYEILGVPRNPAIPANADPAFHDLGLGGPKRRLPRDDPRLAGAFRTPGLRNVAVKPAFMHNGRFATLEDVVAFYSTRDSDPRRWYPAGERFDDLPPALRGNVDDAAPPFRPRPDGSPRLGPADIADLVAFLRALTDREFAAALPPPAAAGR